MQAGHQTDCKKSKLQTPKTDRIKLMLKNEMKTKTATPIFT
jgi:hypothetical protein